MKKILSLLVLMVAFTSCEEDIKFNTPAVQGFKDNTLWRADAFTATIGIDGSLVIAANTGFESIVLKASNFAPGTYPFGMNESDVLYPSQASYTISEESGVGSTYSTTLEGGRGQIVISSDARETNLAQGYISGSFRFNAVNDEGVIVYFADGVFYKVPLTTAVPQ
jgi:hypothetical protein